MESGGSSRPHRWPHITVNSGSGRNILGSMSPSSPHSSTAGTPGVSRQLAPPHMSPTGQSSQIPSPRRYSSLALAESSEMLLRHREQELHDHIRILQKTTPLSQHQRCHHGGRVGVQLRLASMNWEPRHGQGATMALLIRRLYHKDIISYLRRGY
jgi:hypothetical protein